MNFQYITPIEKPADLLDLAFRKARVKGKMKKLTGNWLQIVRQKEAMKLDIIKDSLVTRLDKIVDIMPKTIELPDFYVKLMELTMDFSEYKKSCGAIDWASKQIRNIHKSCVSKVYKEKDRSEIKKMMNMFYGRVSSIVKQVAPNFEVLKKARLVFRSFPDVKEMFTVCLYGFPNVGKSTLLNKLAGTNAETAAYAFTTKSINSGTIHLGGEDIQILDVPGTLARKNTMNDVELQADLVLHEKADVVIYIFDISGFCGFSVEVQEQLLENLQKMKDKKIIVYVTKQDLDETKEALKNFSWPTISIENLKEKIAKIVEDTAESRIVPEEVEEEEPLETSNEDIDDDLEDDSDENREN
jgi:nucleolar GTP-binding protein